MQDAAALNPDQNPNCLEIIGEAIPVNVAPGWLWTVSGPGLLYWGWGKDPYDALGRIHWHIVRAAEIWQEAVKSGQITQRGLIEVPIIVIEVPRPRVVRQRRWTPWGLA